MKKIQPYFWFTIMFFSFTIISLVFSQGSDLMRMFIMILGMLTILFGFYAGHDILKTDAKAKSTLINDLRRYANFISIIKNKVDLLKSNHKKLYWICYISLWICAPIEMGIFTVITKAWTRYRNKNKFTSTKINLGVGEGRLIPNNNKEEIIKND